MAQGQPDRPRRVYLKPLADQSPEAFAQALANAINQILSESAESMNTNSGKKRPRYPVDGGGTP